MKESAELAKEIRLSSGFPALDEVLEGPRWGDTVIFHLDHLREYCLFFEPLAKFLEAEGIKSHYIHFLSKPFSLRSEHSANTVHYLDQEAPLESKAAQLCRLIASEEPGAFYIFDNLADIGRIPDHEARVLEFVRTVFGEIVRRPSAAYMALQRDFLPPDAVASIKREASIFIDVWSIDNVACFQPVKVAGRYSEKMFQRYQLLDDGLHAISGAAFEEYAYSLEKKSREFLELYSQKRGVERDLQKKVFELSLINDITRSLLSTMDLEEILYRILIGVTAKEGLGFNRAFLLLVNEQEEVLEGKMAIGPSSLEEALRIWTVLSEKKISLPELGSFDPDWQQHDVHVNRLAHQIRVPLNDRSHILTELVRQMQPEIVGFGIPSHHRSDELLRLLGVDSFAAVPLVYRKRCLGLLLADNLITQKEISDDDVKMLETFANYASSAIEHSRLYEEVRSRIKESERHIHELEAMQDRLLRSKKLSELGELASKMAHEIRTPLVSIGGFANVLLKKRSSDSEDYESLKIIVEEVRRLEGIISHVLAYVSPGIPRRRDTDLKELLHRVHVMLGLPLQEKRIEMEIRCDDLPVSRVDPDQMKQVFTAIVNNAIESMNEGGKLTIRLSRQDDFLRITFSDTGGGIPEDKRDKVFDAFFTTKSTGSGLGLNIASQIIANHKGSIFVESQVGVGSTFIINLPLAVA